MMKESLGQLVENAVRESVLEAVEERAFKRYHGPLVEQLAERLSELFSGSHVLPLSSGSAALEIGLRGLGIAAGDCVLISAYDYPGNSWAIERVGARPVLLDTRPDGWDIDLDKLEVAIDRTENCRALVASHLHGQTQSSEVLLEVCSRRGIQLIEDCCQSLGARRSGRPVGTFGTLATLSFGGGKLLSAGRGGALVCSDPRLMQSCRIAAGAGSGPYAMSEIQAAIVAAQLPWLERINAMSAAFFRRLAATLQELQDQQDTSSTSKILFPFLPAEEAAFYQAGMILPKDTIGTGAAAGQPNLRDALASHLRDSGIQAGTGFNGMHRRSTRRCEKPVTIESTPTITSTTLVIHHHVAIYEQHSSESLAREIHQFLQKTAT